MRTTLTLSANLNCNPFLIFDQDVDEVIMLINFYIELGASSNSNESVNTKSKETRIRVNDKTATGGWW